jgi:7-cyano-7-deazaguanine synthase
MQENDGVAVVSGGLDSITMVYYLIDSGSRPRLLSFDYGQKHKKELDFAKNTAMKLSLDWNLVDLSSITGLIGNSALTQGAEVPEGHYAEDNMALTVVPNRNMMMLAIATAVAVNDKLSYVAAGMHAGDHAQYPDCRPEFIRSMNHAITTANEGFINAPGDIFIRAPWLFQTKNDIARNAFELNVPLEETWSCYKGGEKHCGRCGTCVERLEAIHSVEGAPANWDKTEYEDRAYWETAVSEFQQGNA